MKTAEPLIHAQAKRQLSALAASPPHAVLLTGPTGSGKYDTARFLAEAVLGLEPGRLSNYAYKAIITSDDHASIGIDKVRQLEHFLSLKVPVQTAHNRAIIIVDAHRLTDEAQNALLKTLEEPPGGVFIVLTAHSPQALLPTIRSRVQTVGIRPPEPSELKTYFRSHGFGEPEIDQAYAISGGLPGLMRALLEDADHPLKLATDRARQLLSQTVYERLLTVDELSKQRQLAVDTVFILQQMASLKLRTASGQTAAKWQAVLAASYKAAEALQANGQAKLVLTDLMLSF